MANTTLFRAFCCGLLCVGTLCSTAMAAPQPPRYPERQVYNPVTGTWLAAPAPVPGTEQGDLQLAMIDLAEDRPKQAKDRLKKWLKKYPASDLRAEAMVAQARAVRVRVANLRFMRNSWGRNRPWW